MLQSALFTKTLKEASADADSINAKLLTRAGYVWKTMAGVYSYLPLGLKVLKNIEMIVREEMDAIGGQEVQLSALAPKQSWAQTGRWDAVDVLFKVPAAGDQEYALNPTHEEVVTPLMQSFVQSYRDLPRACYQIQTKFRNEPRAKSGVLRGREFLMKDLYSFHATMDDLDAYYEKAMGAYDRVFARLGFADRTYLTYASGGTFSQYSHEYQIVLPQGEDTIFVSVDAEKQGKRIAVNKEIFVPGTTLCPVTGGKDFREERASEAGNIFKLGSKFSDAFGFTFAAEDGAKKPVVMGCYGIGISRLLGITAEAMSDDVGLKWPAAIAPMQVHIVPLAKGTGDESYAVATALYETLRKKHIDALFDDRIDLSTGSRLADADLLGMPLRVLVSPKSLKEKQVEVKDRISGAVTLETVDAFLARL